MHFHDFLQTSANEINHQLESLFKELNKEVDQISSRLLPHILALNEACSGGKRIRGALVKLGYEMANGKRQIANGEVLKISAAYEIFQAAILAHDDIIDKSLLRRGRPSLYAQFGAGHMGISKAICLGDIGFFLAFKLITTANFPDKHKNNALKIFSSSMLDTGIGELLDVELSQKELSESHIQDIISIYKFKTAHYTIAAPLLLGAVLSGSNDKRLQAIRNFGQNLGIAFQIQDDINDIFSEKNRLGKETGGDIKEGKGTLLYVYAKAKADSTNKSLLKKYYGNPKITKPEIATVKNIFLTSGALEYARSEALSYSQKAKEYIPEITVDKKYGQMLLEMTEFLLSSKIKDQISKPS